MRSSRHSGDDRARVEAPARVCRRVRLLLLAHDKFDARNAKTAHSVLKYAVEGWSGDRVVGVVDRAKAGHDASEFVGAIGKGVPIFASTRDALDATGADALLIGIAPVGGALPADWRDDVLAALDAGLRVISGLHTSLARDESFAPRRERIRDVRHEHPPPRITTGDGLFVDSLVVTLIGTDCNSGKMTAAIELTKEARRRGLRAAFVATGQTGIMVGCAAGAPLDAIISDFVAGAMEECVLNAARDEPDIIFVEGQGSLTHPAYSGVTASLVHGSFADVLVLADEPRRTHLRMPPGPVAFVKGARSAERMLAEEHLRATSGGRVGGVALMTPGLSDSEYAAERAAVEKEMGVPAGDVFRGDAARILDGVFAEARRRGLWTDAGFARGVKPARRTKVGA